MNRKDPNQGSTSSAVPLISETSSEGGNNGDQPDVDASVLQIGAVSTINPRQRRRAAQKFDFERRKLVRKIPHASTSAMKGFRGRNILDINICRMLGAPLPNYTCSEPPASIGYQYGLVSAEPCEVMVLSETPSEKAQPASDQYRAQRDGSVRISFYGSQIQHFHRIRTSVAVSKKPHQQDTYGYAVFWNTRDLRNAYGVAPPLAQASKDSACLYALFLALLQIKALNDASAGFDIYCESEPAIQSVETRYQRWSLADCPIAWKEKASRKRRNEPATCVAGLLWELRFRGISVTLCASTEHANAKAMAQLGAEVEGHYGPLPVLLRTVGF